MCVCECVCARVCVSVCVCMCVCACMSEGVIDIEPNNKGECKYVTCSDYIRIMLIARLLTQQTHTLKRGRLDEATISLTTMMPHVHRM